MSSIYKDLYYNSVTNKQDLLMLSLSKFFMKKDHIQQMIPIIEGKSEISLRIIDWFVTNYAKKKNTTYIIKKKNKDINQFIVYLNYKSQLKSYSKKQFDPFCRRERINFYYTPTDYLRTTVGQLNFFRWSIENHVLEYIKKHIGKIEKDMNVSFKNAYTVSRKNNSKNKKIRKKRTELSSCATRTVNKHRISIRIEFT
tara:strand:+ start:25 stop:618 length:594 start_codon:yes stop_codon:yes gene_type:complete